MIRMQKVQQLIQQAEQNGFEAVAKLYWAEQESFSVRVYDHYWDFRLPGRPVATGSYYAAFVLFAGSAWVSFRSFSLSQVSGRSESDCQTFLIQLVHQLGQAVGEPNHKGWWGCYTPTVEQANLFLREMNQFVGMESR